MPNPLLRPDPAQVEHEARAKIFWGDAPEEVIKYLYVNGVSVENATIMVNSMFAERAATIRGIGLRKILIGIPLICVPLISYSFFARLMIFPAKLFALTVMVGLYGVWNLLKGSIMFCSPKSEPGDVADK